MCNNGLVGMMTRKMVKINSLRVKIMDKEYRMDLSGLYLYYTFTMV